MQFHVLRNINSTKTGSFQLPNENGQIPRETMLLLKNMVQKHELDQLEIGSNVPIYDPGKTSYKHWHKIGRIVEVLPKKQQGFPNGGGGVG